MRRGGGRRWQLRRGRQDCEEQTVAEWEGKRHEKKKMKWKKDERHQRLRNEVRRTKKAWEQKLRRAGKLGQEAGEGGEKVREDPCVRSLPPLQEGSPQELCRVEGPRTSGWPRWLC